MTIIALLLCLLVENDTFTRVVLLFLLGSHLFVFVRKAMTLITQYRRERR